VIGPTTTFRLVQKNNRFDPSNVRYWHLADMCVIAVFNSVTWKNLANKASNWIVVLIGYMGEIFDDGFQAPLGDITGRDHSDVCALFVVALFVKGWTKELLLEIGVFLVSVKLILMNLKNARAVEGIEKKLDQLLAEK